MCRGRVTAEWLGAALVEFRSDLYRAMALQGAAIVVAAAVLLENLGAIR